MPQLAAPDAFKRRYSRTALHSSQLPELKAKRYLGLTAPERTSAAWKLLPNAAKEVYNTLRTYGIPVAGSKTGPWVWYMSYAELAEETGFNRRTVRRAVARLVVLGLVSREVRRELQAKHHRGPGWVATRYTVYPVSVVNAEALLADIAQRRAARRTTRSAVAQEDVQDAAAVDPIDQAAQALADAQREREWELRLEASARALQPAVKDQQEAVSAALDQLAALGALPPPPKLFARNTANLPATCAADQARSRRADAGQALEMAERRLEGLLQVLDAQEPPTEKGAPVSWGRVVAAIQLALIQAAGAQRLQQEALQAHDLAREVYLQALQAFEAAAGQARLPLVRPPPEQGAPWYPPEAWSPLVGGRTESSWWRQRETWRAAKAQGVGAILERLLAQGFDPEWTDPPPKKTATGPP